MRKKVNKAQEKVNHGQKHSREGVTAGHHRTVRHHRTPPTAQRTPTDTTTAAGTTDSTAAAQGERGRRAHHPGASERAQTGAVQCSAVQCSAVHASVRPSVRRSVVRRKRKRTRARAKGEQKLTTRVVPAWSPSTVLSSPIRV